MEEQKSQVAIYLKDGQRVLITFKEPHFDWTEPNYQPIESAEIVNIVAEEDEETDPV